MLNLKIEIDGKELDDLVLALEEILRKIGAGYLAGFDQIEDDSGKYSFNITGKAEQP